MSPAKYESGKKNNPELKLSANAPPITGKPHAASVSLKGKGISICVSFWLAIRLDSRSTMAKTTVMMSKYL
jgi:hypothetical protein